MSTSTLIQPLTIRNARPDEREQMVRVTLLANKAFEPDAPPGMWPHYEAEIRAAILENRQPPIPLERIVALLGDAETVVGSVLLYPESEKSLGRPEIRLLAVDPAYRKQGIAKQLMAECEARVRAGRKTELCLHTTALMEVARQMYERMGYQRWPEIDFEPRENFRVIGYVKELSDK